MHKPWPHAVKNCCYHKCFNVNHYCMKNWVNVGVAIFRWWVDSWWSSIITSLHLFTLSTHKQYHHIPPSVNPQYTQAVTSHPLSVHPQYTQAVSSHPSICSLSVHTSSIITFLNLFTLSTHIRTRYSKWRSPANYFRTSTSFVEDSSFNQLKVTFSCTFITTEIWQEITEIWWLEGRQIEVGLLNLGK